MNAQPDRSAIVARLGLFLAFLVPAALIGLMIWSSRTRAFDPDEFQHVEFAWLIATGTIPYRDVFEHHTPLYHMLVSPMLAGHAITTSGDAAIAAVLNLRLLGIALCAAILAMTALIMRRIAGPLAAAAAPLVLASNAIFALKGVEIRPDQLACLLLLASTLALVRGRDSKQVLLPSLASGAAAALAVLTTQKLVFALPGLAITFAIFCIEQRLSRGRIVVALGSGLVGAILALAPMLVWLQTHGALSAFVTDNFLLGAHWPRDSRPLVLILAGMFRDETLILLLAAIGAFCLLSRRITVTRWPLAVLAPLLSMAVLMPLFPVVQAQYIFLFLPYLAMLAGFGVAWLVERLVDGLLARALVTTLVLGSVALHGALAIKTQSTATEDNALAALRYTVEQTPADATVLRGWSRGMVFRRPAFRYFSLNPEIRAIVPAAEMNDLADGLRNAGIAPTLVEMDDAMRQMPLPVVAALTAGWQPAGIGDIWRRRHMPPR